MLPNLVVAGGGDGGYCIGYGEADRSCLCTVYSLSSKFYCKVNARVAVDPPYTASLHP
jgi:hypothetical protein